MKVFPFLFGIVAAFVLGYSFEPDIYKAVTGKAPERKKVEPEPEVAEAVEPEDEKAVRQPETTEPAVAFDPASIPAGGLPEKVTLKADAEISNEAGDIRMTVTAGNRVNLVRLVGGNAIISPGPGPFQGSVPIIQTDLAEQLEEIAKNPPAEPAPQDPVEIAGTGTPEETIPEADPEPAVEPEPEPQPEPEPVPAAAPAAGGGDVVAVMQASIRDGEIKEFAFDQVLDWEAGGDEQGEDGQTYQTGIASYKAETVFGVKTIQAKALIQNGKVVRWLWPKSGMEIK